MKEIFHLKGPSVAFSTSRLGLVYFQDSVVAREDSGKILSATTSARPDESSGTITELRLNTLMRRPTTKFTSG